MEMSTEVQRGDTLLSSLSAYSVLEFIGEGYFGKVAKCLNIRTRETVAIKICKETPGVFHDTKKEISTLERLSVLDPESSNLIRFIERFDHVGQCCLAFEMLDIDLYDLLNSSPPLSVSAIRPIAQQLMVALDALKGLGIVHCDIKPDNIMLVSRSQPFRVKLIDFGEAIPITQLPRGPLFQPLGYRAPEVSLGLPLTEAIDMWGVGCVLASLFLADNLFAVNCDYLMMKQIVITLGQPEDYLLAAGKNTHRYFKQDPWWNLEDPLAWRLLTPREYEAENSRSALLDYTVPLRSLEDLAHIYSGGDSAEMEDRLAFADFLKDVLHLDGFMRISPATALQHSYLTMRHQVMSPEMSDDTTSVMGSSPTPHQPLPSFASLSLPSPASPSPSQPLLSFPNLSLPSPASPSPPQPLHSASASQESDLASLASASTSRSRKLLKRVRSFFSRLKTVLCCCCRAEED